jgi:tetratricopeptide (TPR) repeat protein
MTVLFTVFIVSRDLANGLVSGKYFWFYASMVLLSVFAIPAAIIKRRERVSFQVSDLLILLFCAASVLTSLHHTVRLPNKCMLLIFATAFYFYLRIFLAGKNKLIYELCGLAFVITGLVEAVWGLMQLYGFTSSHHHLFKTTGSFFNPGPYSGWLATVFPFALGYALISYFKCKGQGFAQSLPPVARFLSLAVPYSKTVLCLLAVLSIVLILPAAMSRASWLAALGGCAFIGIPYGLQNKKTGDWCKRYRKHIIRFSFAAFVLFAVAMSGLFLLKKDSASGRAFTWKIAAQTIMEHPMGVGLGNFGGAYGDAQAAYFASGAGAEWEEHVAEGVEYAFNEYLQICIEAGIIPFIIFIAFAVYTLSSGIRRRNYIPAGALVSLLIFAAMSYPFNVLPFVIAFVFLSALCMADSDNKTDGDKPKRPYPKFVIWVFLIAFPLSVVLLSSASSPNSQFSIFNFQLNYSAHKQWRATQTLHGMGLHREAAEEFSGQYPYLQDNIKFLFEYAQSLSKSEQYGKSNEILRRAMQISCDPMLYNVMGKNCQALKQYEQAEQCFIKAVNLVPNRLYPHYLLAKLYHETGQKEKAETETDIVLNKPPKVESMAVEEMRKELIKLRTKN